MFGMFSRRELWVSLMIVTVSTEIMRCAKIACLIPSVSKTFTDEMQHSQHCAIIILFAFFSYFDFLGKGFLKIWFLEKQERPSCPNLQ